MSKVVIILVGFLFLSQSTVFTQSDKTFLVERLASGPEVDFTDFPDFSAIYITSDVPSLRISSEISLVTRIAMSHTDNILIVTPTAQRIVFEALGYERETLSLPILRPGEVVWVRVSEFVKTATTQQITEISDVLNPKTGRIWMDRNLGASRAAISSTDPEAYGDLYQWGRGSDGHEKRNSQTTSTLSNSAQPGNNRFIVSLGGPFDWLSPQNSDLWQGASGLNNPCPVGYRLPTDAEWALEISSWGNGNASGAFASPLKLPLAGQRDNYSGLIYEDNSFGRYWSSSVEGGNAFGIFIFASNVSGNISYGRGRGLSVRCIKELHSQISSIDSTLPAAITTSVTNITTTSAVVEGSVTSFRSSNILARGVCYSTSVNPSTSDQCILSGNGDGSFLVRLEGLSMSTLYYIRVYAINASGTLYGNQVIISTLSTSRVRSEKIKLANDVTNPRTGRTWMDRNLGASRVATSPTDELAYGDLYQWGRSDDGHETRDSATTSLRSNRNQPNHSSFILVSDSPYDWRNSRNDNLWQGTRGDNNPCPTGYRVPTQVEWEIEISSWASIDAIGAFSSQLKLPLTGFRNLNTGLIEGVGLSGDYWSSSVDGIYARRLHFSNRSGLLMNSISLGRASGGSVRCIKD